MNKTDIHLETLKHSCSHVMAGAVKKLYPAAKFGIGPAIENGFYYDIDCPGGIKEEDLPKIEELMREEIKQDHPFIQKMWSKPNAKKFFQEQGQPYKLELIEGLDTEEVSIYEHDNFVDLCRGPHVSSTGAIKFFKLLSLSGAYWRGDENNAQLTRIYGAVFNTKEELDTYLQNVEEAKKRDHRLLGKQLRLFDIYHEEAGAGVVFYLPKGATLRRIIEQWEETEHKKRGYQVVITPHLMHQNLWAKSGHLDHYAEFMYPIEKENQGFILKPMNCPGHILIYKSEIRSWRDLPLRLFELGTVYRYEKSGVLHGLLRVRGFTQDDAHIFCQEEDLQPELEGVLDFVSDAMRAFGFSEFEAELSTRPENYIGEVRLWEKAEQILEEVLKKKKIAYQVNPGDGAFYGPKIDIKLKDALQRSWQCATVQLDYSLPEKFDLTYRAPDGTKKRVVMLHRVILGSLERFIATLIEHYAGKFPLWLAPVQVSILTITDDLVDYAKGVFQKIGDSGCRVELDTRDETLQKKIRENELQKIPYLIILGKKEEEKGLMSVRQRGGKNLGTMTPEEFIALMTKEKEVLY
ncbi:MAG: threonine--tRNA ligase [Candidatus Omnitrophica bacterium]|nr:threonine--tRNA ligase [Candidatus Omnitrophota bacterium]